MRPSCSPTTPTRSRTPESIIDTPTKSPKSTTHSNATAIWQIGRIVPLPGIGGRIRTEPEFLPTPVARMLLWHSSTTNPAPPNRRSGTRTPPGGAPPQYRAANYTLEGFRLDTPRVAGAQARSNAIVESVGDTLAVGDHVVLSFDSCGVCGNCRDGHPAYFRTFLARNLTGTALDGSTPLEDSHGSAVAGRSFGQSSFATHSVVDAVVVDKDLPSSCSAPSDADSRPQPGPFSTSSRCAPVTGSSSPVPAP